MIDYYTKSIGDLNISAQVSIAAKPLKSQYLGNVLIDPSLEIEQWSIEIQKEFL
jgi:hypothetical protein